MSKFKVGDKVVLAPGNSGVEYFYALQGKREYYTITDKASASGYWLQLDGVVRSRVDLYPWHRSFFNMYQEPENELPPVPDKVAYMNSKRDSGNDQRLVLEKDSGLGESLMYIGVIPRKGSTRAQEEIGINIDPDSALQLAHDLRRMAMEIKRKEKAQ